MSIRELIQRIAETHSMDDILYILGKDTEWLLWKIKADLIERRDEFISGDEYYTGIIEE